MTGGRSKGNAKSAQYRIVAVEHRTADAELPPMDQPIPNDFSHLHFGAGQTEAKITLPLGKHTLRLLFADAAHVPHLFLFLQCDRHREWPPAQEALQAPPSLAVLLIAIPR